jgi:hypothetical protein
MTSTRRRIALIAVPAAMVAGLALAPAAGALVYCVPNNAVDPSCQTPQATLQAALTAANANAGNDTVRLGSGMFTAANSFGFTYFNGDGNVSIIGVGQGQTTLTIPPDPGDMFYINNVLLLDDSGGGSSVSNLTVSLPTPSNNNMFGSQYRAVEVEQGQFDRVTVTAPATAINGYGFWVDTGPTTIDNSTVTFPPPGGENGVIADGQMQIEDSSISASTGFLLRGSAAATHSVKRSSINASDTGVNLEMGTLNLESTQIDLGSSGSIGVRSTGNSGVAEMASLNLDHATIVRTNAGGEGVRVEANDATQADSRTATITNTVISGLGIPIRRIADNMDTANVTTDFSNYNSAANSSSNGANGMGMITQTNQTNLAPGFVNPAVGNYHLAPSSALIDIGDPNAPMGFDIDGDPRGLDGAPPCVPMAMGTRDIGADEYNCVPPDTAITGGPTGLSNNPLPSFSFSSEPGATFQCRFDLQPFGTCSGPGAAHMPGTPLSDGPHQFEVRALDLNANPDPTPAARSLTVDTTAPDTAITGKGKVKTRKKRARVSWTLSFTEMGATLECSLDGGPFVPCGSLFTARLPRGVHTLMARSTDALGNKDASPASFTTKVKKKRVKKKRPPR